MPHLDTLDGQAYKDADAVMVLIKVSALTLSLTLVVLIKVSTRSFHSAGWSCVFQSISLFNRSTLPIVLASMVLTMFTKPLVHIVLSRFVSLSLCPSVRIVFAHLKPIV